MRGERRWGPQQERSTLQVDGAIVRPMLSLECELQLPPKLPPCWVENSELLLEVGTEGGGQAKHSLWPQHPPLTHTLLRPQFPQ